MLPNFMIIGVAKCGTTTLCNALENHPDVFITQPKEPNYFNKSIHYESSRPEYEKLYNNAGDKPFCGEGSVSYTNPNRINFIPQRIHQLIPDCKIIYMVRHPIKRLESDWKMQIRLDNTTCSFEEALQYDMMLYNHGLYWKTLSYYLKYFKKEQILTIFMEDLHQSFDEEFTKVLNHIGADTNYKATNTHSNSAQSYRQDTQFSALLKGLLGNSIKSKIPDSLKDAFRKKITKEWSYEINWDKNVYEEVSQYFIEDSQKLLDHCGKSRDFWSFNFPG